MNGRARAAGLGTVHLWTMRLGTIHGIRAPSAERPARIRRGFRVASPLAAAIVAVAAGSACPLHVASATTVGQRASAADQDSGGHRCRGGLVLVVTTPDLAGSAHRDFELNFTRGLRFSGLDVVAESAEGAAPALGACAEPACVRAIGATRAAAALARASVRATSDDGRDNNSRRSYTIEIETFSTSTGRTIIQRQNVCANCTMEVAAHLAYLLATQVGQRISQELSRDANQEIGPPSGPKRAEGPSSTTAPAVADAPHTSAAGPEGPARPISVARTAPAGTGAAPNAPTGPAPTIALDASDRRPTGGPHHLAAGILGGLGVAALTAGAVLWLRGPQSTCPGLPPSACGQTYDDTTTGQVLAGAGAAALAGAILWWIWPAAEEQPKSSPSPHVAITSAGVLVGGRF